MTWALVPPPCMDPVEVEETERAPCPECGCVSERVVGEPFGCLYDGPCVTLDTPAVPEEAREVALTHRPPVLFGGAL
jgi:hypothetical protein